MFSLRQTTRFAQAKSTAPPAKWLKLKLDEGGFAQGSGAAGSHTPAAFSRLVRTNALSDVHPTC
jgi:hypothetical protein